MILVVNVEPLQLSGLCMMAIQINNVVLGEQFIA